MLRKQWQLRYVAKSQYLPEEVTFMCSKKFQGHHSFYRSDRVLGFPKLEISSGPKQQHKCPCKFRQEVETYQRFIKKYGLCGEVNCTELKSRTGVQKFLQLTSC